MNQPVQIEGSLIIIPLLNRVQETLLQNIKEELIAILRETFNRSDIQIQTTFVQQPQARKPYTDQEKLLFLSKKNSAIALLQERLLLEVAY
ncbi:MAG TPA: hypothetical protein VK133_03700 [Amoebophilaceae bacterium]|nr:hypothetical protein [Amoebophilaceae bacterium]